MIGSQRLAATSIISVKCKAVLFETDLSRHENHAEPFTTHPESKVHVKPEQGPETLILTVQTLKTPCHRICCCFQRLLFCGCICCGEDDVNCNHG